MQLQKITVKHAYLKVLSLRTMQHAYLKVENIIKYYHYLYHCTCITETTAEPSLIKRS